MRTDGPVVVALSREPGSEHVLAWGLSEATRLAAPVDLVEVVPEPRDTTLWAWTLTLPDVVDDTDTRAHLADVLTREQARHPDLTITAHTPHGNPAAALRDLSADARLLVVGAGHRPHRTGRVAAHVAAHARCPVAVVRPTTTRTPDGHPAPVVVGVDGSRAARHAATTAAAAAVARDAVLRVVHARPTVQAPYGLAYLPPASEDDPTRTAARALVDDLVAYHPDLRTDLHVVDDDPAHALVQLASDAQLLVVGSRGLGAFPGMLLGSVSHEAVRHAPCTVLVVHGTPDDHVPDEPLLR
ncbi:universal stress protein [Cellulomonas sp. SLBN-39]|uniref:universal stress protein n=1 Tax=Cellulomonas sp. SLBN-39 TaxID=2768446 RepID=UPI001172B359|nr:universal stress protein [Cellulomonas sp. SLBN-39]TQL04111.1 nucleotide-binding universal stress UspA family protein [Cellulomonas sp. SLBN-39]